MNMNDLKAQAARAAVWWRSRPGPAIGRIRARAGVAAAKPEPHGQLRVAVAQVRAGLCGSAEEFAARMGAFVEEARNRGAVLIVFPEDNGTQLLGMLPGLAGLAAQIGLTTGGTQAAGATIGEVCRFMSHYTWRAFTAVFAELAKSYGMYIVSGSIRRQDPAGRLVNMACCYGPDGRLLGTQEKLHLMQNETAWGFVPGRDLTVTEVCGCRLAFPICHDATYFETFRLALAADADLVAVQSANNEDYNEWYARRGIWPRVQESPVYGLASHLVGDLFGVHLTGRSGVYAPLGLTPAGDGVLAMAGNPEAEELIVTDLDLAALRAWRAANPPSVPGDVVLRYLPELYAEGRRRASAQENGGAEQERDQELTGQENEKGSPAPQPVAEEDTDVEQNKAPAVGHEEGQLKDAEGEEQRREDEQIRDLSVPVDQQGIAETGPAAGQAGHEREQGGAE